MDRARRESTRFLSATTFLIGLALIVATIVKGGGPLATGVILGAAFAALGAVRYAAATSKTD